MFLDSIANDVASFSHAGAMQQCCIAPAMLHCNVLATMLLKLETTRSYHEYKSSGEHGI